MSSGYLESEVTTTGLRAFPRLDGKGRLAALLIAPGPKTYLPSKITTDNASQRARLTLLLVQLLRA